MNVKAFIAHAFIAWAFFMEGLSAIPRLNFADARSAVVSTATGARRSIARRPAALSAPLPGPHRSRRRVPRAGRRKHAGFSSRPALADRPGPDRHRPGLARDGAARALLRIVRSRRCARRVLGGALLHGEL